VLELGLRFFASPELIPRPRILADSLNQPVVARRQMDEGVATAHFSTSGARQTGNPPAGHDLTVVILGDSYVLAREVADKQTMGSQLERMARANGIPIDVRQYGWSGASPAQYIYVAHDVIARWHPRSVIITLSENDLDKSSLVEPWPRLRVDRHGNARIVGPPMDTLTLGPSFSSLWMLTRQRWGLLRRRGPAWARPRTVGQPEVTAPDMVQDSIPPPDTPELDSMPGAVVRALAKAYGRNLTLVYMAQVDLDGGFERTPAETRLLETCRVTHVSCVSTRADMLEARRSGIVAHGVSTRIIGHGHFNPRGHGIIAAVMWKALQSDGALADATPQ
jgi:lysophospholipase L1-like esterase